MIGDPVQVWGTKPPLWWERQGPLGGTWRVYGFSWGVTAPIGVIGRSPQLSYEDPFHFVEASVYYKAQFGLGIPPKVGLSGSLKTGSRFK